MECRAVLCLCVCVLVTAVLCAADIQFPDASADQNDTQIPLNLMLKISALENFTDFQDFFDEQSLDKSSTEIVSRFGDEVDRKAVTVPKNALCIPELKVVELIKEKDPALLYFPTCTRIEQCGGCCSSELLKCQPTETETLNYMVYATSYGGSGKFKLRDKMIVSVEKHLACKCGCAVKKEDCNLLQEYDADNCQCRCFNTDEEKKCRAENATKIWDPSNCVCSCRQTLQCSTGYMFDHTSCRCSETTTKRRHITDGESSYRRGGTRNNVPLSVLPLNFN